MLLIQEWAGSFVLKDSGHGGDLQSRLQSDLPSRGQCCTLASLSQMGSGSVIFKVGQVVEGLE